MNEMKWAHLAHWAHLSYDPYIMTQSDEPWKWVLMLTPPFIMEPKCYWWPNTWLVCVKSVGRVIRTQSHYGTVRSLDGDTPQTPPPLFVVVCWKHHSPFPHLNSHQPKNLCQFIYLRSLDRPDERTGYIENTLEDVFNHEIESKSHFVIHKLLELYKNARKRRM